MPTPSQAQSISSSPRTACRIEEKSVEKQCTLYWISNKWKKEGTFPGPPPPQCLDDDLTFEHDDPKPWENSFSSQATQKEIGVSSVIFAFLFISQRHKAKIPLCPPFEPFFNKKMDPYWIPKAFDDEAWRSDVLTQIPNDDLTFSNPRPEKANPKASKTVIDPPSKRKSLFTVS